MKTDSKIVGYEQLTKIREQANRRSQTIVFTSGVYDLLHVGHLKHFDLAKSEGDILVVSVGSDETVRVLKGPTRPIHTEMFRAQMVAALESMDYVVLSKELGKMDHDIIVEKLRPDVYFVPGNDTALQAKRDLIEKYGGKLVTTKRVPPKGAEGISTTQIIGKLTQS